MLSDGLGRLFTDGRALEFTDGPLKGLLRVRGVMSQSDSFGMRATLKQISSGSLAVNQLRLECHALLDAFNRQYPRGRRPAYLAANPDGSLTALRWRVSHGAFPRFELWDSTGADVQSKLPLMTWRSWLEYEKRRQDLNRRMAIALYTQKRLASWVDQRKRLNHLSRTSQADSAPF